MMKFLRISITTLTLVAGCGDNHHGDTAAGATTASSSTAMDDGSTTNHPTTGDSATSTDGMSGTGTNPTTTDGGSTTSNATTTGDSSSTGEACPTGKEDCPCTINGLCAEPNVCVEGTCTCPEGEKDCMCAFGETCVEGTECTEQKLCQGCDALDNDYCPLTCDPTDQIGLKEFPSDPNFPWAMCMFMCAGPDDPSNCPMPEGLEGKAFCLDSPYGPLCQILCVTDEDCGPSGNCMNWGAPEGDFCAYPNPYDKRNYEMHPPQLQLSPAETCTAETCMQQAN